MFTRLNRRYLSFLAPPAQPRDVFMCRLLFLELIFLKKKKKKKERKKELKRVGQQILLI